MEKARTQASGAFFIKRSLQMRLIVKIVAAVIVATLLMMVAAAPVARFIERRPSAKVLALSFILLIGMALIAEGTGFHVPRGYVYFAMGFSLFVEMLNTIRRRTHPHG